MAIPFLDSEDGYKKVIEQIMEFERNRITRLETNVSENDLRKNSLTEIAQQFTMVSNYGRELYGLDSAFKTSAAENSNPEALNTSINGRTDNKKHSVLVKQLATAQTISSSAIAASASLPASEITLKINEKEVLINFAGGTISDFFKELQNNTSFIQHITPRIVQKNAKESVITFSSLQNGVENRIQLIADSGNILTLHLKMFQRNSANERPLLSISDAMGQLSLSGKEDVVVDNKILLLPGQSAELTIGSELNFNEVEYLTYRVYLPQKKPIPSNNNEELGDANQSAVKNNAATDNITNTETTKETPLSTNQTTVALAENASATNTSPLATKKLISTNSNELSGTTETSVKNNATTDNITNTETSKEALLSTNQTTVALAENASATNTSPPLTEEEKKTILAKLTFFKITPQSESTKSLDWQRKPTLLQKTIKRSDVNYGMVMLDSSWLDAPIDGSIYIDKLTLTNTFNKPITAELPNAVMQRKTSGEYKAVNEVIAPQNAVLVYENIEIERDNNEIDNLIPGITITLKKTTTTPTTISTSINSDLIYERIIGFFNAYNQAIELLNIAIAPDEESLQTVNFPEESKKKVGLFNGDYNITRLKEGIRTLITKPYPAVAMVGKKNNYNNTNNEKLKMLIQIGIKRIFSIQNPYDIDNDKVTIDLKKLKNAVDLHGAQIAAFFGANKKGEVIIDSGLAYEMETVIYGYFQRGGYFTMLEERLTTENKNFKKDIESENTRLEERETSLKRDFSQVEAAMQEQKNMESYFNQFNSQ